MRQSESDGRGEGADERLRHGLLRSTDTIDLTIGHCHESESLFYAPFQFDLNFVISSLQSACHLRVLLSDPFFSATNLGRLELHVDLNLAGVCVLTKLGSMS